MPKGLTAWNIHAKKYTPPERKKTRVTSSHKHYKMPLRLSKRKEHLIRFNNYYQY